ncbi:MAG: collagen-like protein [Chloroflexi bacterium]|nr:collagen-like protein [Chloroflexota bacterium]
MTVWLRQRRRALLILLTSLALVAFIACSGDPGTPGSPGAPGVAGDPGSPGSAGNPGEAGISGPVGPAGIPGVPGPAGDDGALGAKGGGGSDGSDGADAIAAAVVVHDSGGTTAGIVADGNTIDVIGGGFAAGEAITLQIAHDGGTDTLNAGSLTANSGGAFAALNLSIPASLSGGDVASIWATGDSGTVGVGTLRVTPSSLTLRIAELGGSGQTGSAVLVSSGSKTNVVVSVGGGAAGVGQPIHIHTGTCEDLGGVEYPLTALLDGRSETTVDVSLQTLLDGRFAVNLHESPTNAGNYTACGGI